MKFKLLLFFMLMPLLYGCEYKSGDELLQPPKPSATYESLQKQINIITANDNNIQVSPQSGENRNTVQLTDLDLDGEDEAIAFFCEANNPNQFHVYVFQKDGTEYVPIGNISGTGVQINSVSYPYISPEGKKGLLISWKLSGDDALMGMTACSFSDGKLCTMLETTYQSSVTSDLDNDGQDELVIFSKDETGRRIAELYACSGLKMDKKGEAVFSPEGQSIVSLKTGLLRGYQPAIFAESNLTLSSGLMTDIFVYDDDGFRNIAISGKDSNLLSTYRPVSVPASDVNADQVTEVPLSLPNTPTASVNTSSLHSNTVDTSAYILDWYAYSAGDNPVRVCTTYQNISENWLITLPDSWRGTVTASKTTENDKTITTFTHHTPNGNKIDLLSIYRLTGDMREYYASEEGMHELYRTQTEIYTLSVPNSAYDSILMLTTDEINERFSVISQAWHN